MFYFSRIKIKHFLSTPLKFKHFSRPVSTLFQFSCCTSVRLREAQKLLARSTCEYFPIFYQRPVLARVLAFASLTKITYNLQVTINLRTGQI